jgi:cysteine desulfurase
VIQPIERIAEQVRGAGGVLFVDCAQSAGKLPLPAADIIAFSAHKLGGPPGVGALWLRDPALIEAVGGQEHGYRPGTENLPAALGFAAAAEDSRDWFATMAPLRRSLDAAIAAAGGEIVAAQSPRIPTIGSYRMPGVPSAAQLIAFDLAGIAVSAGSACSSGSVKPSHVLAAMGWDPVAAREVIRVSFGRMTAAAEVDRFAAEWSRIVERRRAA